MIKKIISGLLVFLLLTLAACQSLPFDIPWLAGDRTTATLPPNGSSDVTPTPEIIMTEEATHEPVTELTVWVPPEMDPDLETEASQLFTNRLTLFSEMNNGLQVNVRVKAASGVGGLLDSLTATSAAAPSALPDVIALSRPDMETAALKGLIFPLDGLTEIPDDADWYAFTREMSLLQGSTFGLPFASDSLVMVYRPDRVGSFSRGWLDLLEENAVFAFPAESDQSLFTLALYQAEGGIIHDNQRRPVLEIEPLTAVFRLLQEGAQTGVFPSDLNQYQTFSQVWTAFREEQMDLAVTWCSNYLQERPAGVEVSPLFSMSDTVVSFGTGMSWSVGTPETHRHPLAADLAEFLVDSDFLSEWTSAAGYIPPRPSSLEGWEDQGLRTTISQIALVTKLRPSNDIIASLGPILREGTRQILQELVDPAQAAQTAVDSLEEQ